MNMWYEEGNDGRDEVENDDTPVLRAQIFNLFILSPGIGSEPLCAADQAWTTSFHHPNLGSFLPLFI